MEDGSVIWHWKNPNRRTALERCPLRWVNSFIGEHERSDLTKAYEETLAHWNLFLYDGFGSFDLTSFTTGLGTSLLDSTARLYF